MLFDRFLPTLQDKWHEVPAAAGRLLSGDLERLDGPGLLARWQTEYVASGQNRDWYRRLYAEPFRGKHLLDVGSGLGFDALFFAAAGVHVTCCDVAAGNLRIISRLAGELGHSIATVPIDGLESLASLGQFDVIWCNGSMLHAPFDVAREESAALLSHLNSGGRWIELAYPRGRWIREGSLPFDRWGKRTDGERTPWAEWYDMEKLGQRLAPWQLRPILEMEFGYGAFIWLDAEVHPSKPSSRPPAVDIKCTGRWVSTPPNLWNHAESVPLPRFGQADIVVEIEISVSYGTVGLCLSGGISPEAFVDARTGSQLVHLKTDRYCSGGETLDIRNAGALGAARYQLLRMTLR
jgi:SAM-dependent methyltransferase